ncbi:RNA-directed DNA polymerase, eukaryota, reverse transcriptase zinc-binding domain protein [Tanacetum coccineum]
MDTTAVLGMSCVFGHTPQQCPKRVIQEQQVNKQEKEVEEDGFTSVSHKRKKGKQHTNTNQKQSDGLKMNKPKVRVVWQKTNQIAHKPDKEASDMDDTNMVPSTGCDSDTPSAGLDKEDNWFASRTTKTTDNDSDSKDIEELILEDHNTKDTGSKSERGFWNWSSNDHFCSKGSRIIVGWNPSEVDLVLISQDDQVVHTRIWFKADKKELFCSFVYAHNHYTHRRGLWFNLAVHKHYIRNRPWSLLGDFNAALNLDDKSVGSSNFDISMREFKECVEDIEVSDVNYTGLKYTWNQKPQGDDGVLKKIDRIMANLVFYDSFVGAYAIFQPYRISDHAPAILKIPMISNVKSKTFKFLNVLVHNTIFKQLVKEKWATPFSGFHMYQVVEKLKHLKKPLRKLLYDQAVYVKACNDALLMEEHFLKHKAKIDWLRVEDSNSAYFHKVVKGRVHQNRIDAVMNVDGLVVTGDQVPLAFEAHFSSFLGQQGVNQALNSDNLFINTLDSHVASYMIRVVSTHKVKQAVFKIGNDKSPGPDGYTASFFKEAWDVVSTNITKAVQEFFINGSLLKKVDIQKAYDTFDWKFLRKILCGFGFHPRMVTWIMKCVPSTFFSLNINGTLHGYFKGKRGLRQGDPCHTPPRRKHEA